LPYYGQSGRNRITSCLPTTRTQSPDPAIWQCTGSRGDSDTAGCASQQGIPRSSSSHTTERCRGGWVEGFRFDGNRRSETVKVDWLRRGSPFSYPRAKPVSRVVPQILRRSLTTVKAGGAVHWTSCGSSRGDVSDVVRCRPGIETVCVQSVICGISLSVTGDTRRGSSHNRVTASSPIIPGHAGTLG
jgi:hypothetical protein